MGILHFSLTCPTQTHLTADSGGELIQQAKESWPPRNYEDVAAVRLREIRGWSRAARTAVRFASACMHACMCACVPTGTRTPK
jgi:hypothetical protein